MTDPTETTRQLLRRAESYLSALHGSVARHDNLAANFGCAGCELRDQIQAALTAAPAGLVAVPPTTADRDRIAEALYAHNHPGWATRYIDLDQDERDTYLARADAVLRVLPAESGDTVATRAAVLRDFLWRLEQSAGDAAAEKFLDDNPELRRLAAETQPSEAPWATDGARIGRALIWSWARVGDSDFGQGYRTAQEDVRAILTRPLLGAEEKPEPEPDAPRREPHPTEADLRHALAVAAKFHSQNTDAPAAFEADPASQTSTKADSKAGPSAADTAEEPRHVGGNAEDCPACEGTNPPYPFICPEPPAAVARPNKATVPCSAVGFRVRHNPHSWEPQPEMDLVRCPGYAAPAAVSAVGQTDEETANPRTVCVCGHTRAEHLRVSGRLLCDTCDPDSTENLVCKEFEAL